MKPLNVIYNIQTFVYWYIHERKTKHTASSLHHKWVLYCIAEYGWIVKNLKRLTNSIRWGLFLNWWGQIPKSDVNTWLYCQQFIILSHYQIRIINCTIFHFGKYIKVDCYSLSKKDLIYGQSIGLYIISSRSQLDDYVIIK